MPSQKHEWKNLSQEERVNVEYCREEIKLDTKIFRGEVEELLEIIRRLDAELSEAKKKIDWMGQFVIGGPNK